MDWVDQHLTTGDRLVMPISSSNGSYTSARLGRVEKRVEGMEHYVHGRGWVTRLVAWVGLALAVAAGFAIQQYRIDQIHQHMEPATKESSR